MLTGGGPGGNRTHIRGFAVRCITTLPPDLTGVCGLVIGLAGPPGQGAEGALGGPLCV